MNRIIQLEKDTAEDVNATLSLTKNFVHAVECELRITPSEGQYKEKMRGNLITVKKNTEGRSNSSSVGTHSKWITYHGAGLPSKKKPPLGPLSGNVQPILFPLLLLL